MGDLYFKKLREDLGYDKPPKKFCMGRTQEGRKCKMYAMKGTDRCYHHSRPQKTPDLRRIKVPLLEKNRKK